VINSQHYTEKADVFSFGIILWEIYTRAIPYDGMQPVQVVAAVLGRRERPRIPSRCPAPLSQLMQQCWAHDPNVRPSFNEIVPWLEGLPP
jgi:Protein tyrosine and serine/threonine kinase